MIFSSQTKEDMDAYEQSLKYYRDYVNTIDYARVEEARKIALNMLEKGFTIEQVCVATGLSEKEVKELQKK